MKKIEVLQRIGSEYDLTRSARVALIVPILMQGYVYSKYEPLLLLSNASAVRDSNFHFENFSRKLREYCHYEGFSLCWQKLLSRHDHHRVIFSKGCGGFKIGISVWSNDES